MCSFHGKPCSSHVSRASPCSYANRGSGTKRVSFDEVEPQVFHLWEQKSVRPRAPSRRGCFNHPLCPHSAFSCFRFSGMFFLAGVQGVEPCPSRYHPGVLPLHYTPNPFGLTSACFVRNRREFVHEARSAWIFTHYSTFRLLFCWFFIWPLAVGPSLDYAVDYIT